MYKHASRFAQRRCERGVREANLKSRRSGGLPKSEMVVKMEQRAAARTRRDWFAYIDACRAQGSEPVGVPPDIEVAYTRQRPSGGLPPNRSAAQRFGTVKSCLPAKGHGFLRPEGGGPDVFVHASAVRSAGLDQLRPGQRVSYQLVRHGRRIQTGMPELMDELQ